MSIYDNYKWNQKRFNLKISNLPKGFWDNEENRTELIRRLTKDLKVEDLSDWYRVSFSQINEKQKYMIVFKKYSLDKLLSETYPNFEFHSNKLQFRQGLRASQRSLFFDNRIFLLQELILNHQLICYFLNILLEDLVF